MVGMIVAAYAIPQFILRIPVGVLFDSLARKKSLLVGGIVMNIVGALGLGLAPNPWVLFLARAVTGIGGATWVSFTVYFTAYYPPGNSRRAISIMSFVQSFGQLVATYSGGLVAQLSGYSSTFFGAAALGVIGLITLPFTSEPAMPEVKRMSWNSFRPVATYPPLLIVSFMALLFQFINWAGLFGFVPVYAARIGATSADLGTITMLSLASTALASLLVVRVARLRGPSFTILLGSIFLAATMGVIPLINHVSLLMVIMFINGVGRGLLATILMALSIQAVSQQQRATAMGIFQATYALGMLAGPLASGFLANSSGLAAVFYLSTFFCLVLAGTAYLPSIKHVGIE
jgi:MFS family permease